MLVIHHPGQLRAVVHKGDNSFAQVLEERPRMFHYDTKKQGYQTEKNRRDYHSGIPDFTRECRTFTTRRVLTGSEQGHNELRDLLKFGGFVEEAEGAQRSADRAVGFVGLVADHDDGCGGVAFADDAEEFDAASVRQMDIEEQDIRRTGIDK